MSPHLATPNFSVYLSHFSGDNFISFIGFVANQKSTGVFIGMFVHIFQPIHYVVKGIFWCDIVDENHAICSSIISTRDGPITLLTWNIILWRREGSVAGCESILLLFCTKIIVFLLFLKLQSFNALKFAFYILLLPAVSHICNFTILRSVLTVRNLCW